MCLIGIFGGTFDPVHRAHIQVARDVYAALALDHVRLIPCHRSPLRDSPVVNDAQRLHMLRLATQGIAGLVVDARELNADSASYSVDTLHSLKQEFPQDHLCMIIGGDAFLQFTQWHRWQQILQLAHIIIAQRPGYTLQPGAVETRLLEELRVSDVTGLHASEAGRIYVCGVTQLEISATQLRATLARGDTPITDIDPGVKQYIQQSGLYQ